ncbi:hypothetical protein SNE40_018214 [Patella caerulea]|uniref:Uncharacterized protein n=1 Tax=Patella caerulea TaxID=87958 RepID=A0AAN8JC42_PATCE
MKQQIVHKTIVLKIMRNGWLKLARSKVYLSSSEKRRIQNLISFLTQTVQTLKKDIKDLKINRPVQSKSMNAGFPEKNDAFGKAGSILN